MLSKVKEKLIGYGVTIAASIAAVVIVIESEGLELKPYLDPKKIKTVCYGHTGNVKDKKHSVDECLALLSVDLIEAEQILRLNSGLTYNKMNNNQKAAFISFIYNVGYGGKGVKDGFVYLKNGNHSTMYKKINAGDIEGACYEIPKWCKDCKELRGLKIRRAKEFGLCVSKDY